MKQTKGIYESADGKLWRDAKKCKQHDAWLQLVELCEHIKSDPEFGSEAMASWIVEYKDFLLKLLKSDPLKDGGELPVDGGGD
jgi:hypothetical protein